MTANVLWTARFGDITFGSMATPAEELDSFIDKFAPANQTLIRSLRRALRKRLPTAHELVYDNYNFFVIGYSPTERPSDAVISIAAAAKGVSLCFVQGAKLPDPAGLLRGEGKQVRSLPLLSAKTLADPAVERFIGLAFDNSRAPLDDKVKGKLIIRSISAKQRPRQ